MSKHTPGPWFFRFHPGIGKGYWVSTKDGTVISPRVETLEDATLSAAAPDLLDALRVAVRQNAHDMLMTGEELRMCEAAIAKAEGKS